MPNSVTLKWGSLKSWNLETDDAIAAVKKWGDYVVSLSAMCQRDTPEQKQALIDAMDFMDEIWLDWEDKQVTREEAKEYIRNYGKPCGQVSHEGGDV
jgi:hypothetical protein